METNGRTDTTEFITFLAITRSLKIAIFGRSYCIKRQHIYHDFGNILKKFIVGLFYNHFWRFVVMFIRRQGDIVVENVPFVLCKPHFILPVPKQLI